MIPKKINDQLNNLSRIKTCENCGALNVQRHHALMYGKKAMQEVYAIRALCDHCHTGNSIKPLRRADVISKINAIEDGLEHLKSKYPKRNWEQQLNQYKHELRQIDDAQRELLTAKLNGYA